MWSTWRRTDLLGRQPWLDAGGVEPHEVRGVDLEVLDGPADVCVSAAGLVESEDSEHARDGGRPCHRIGEQFIGVLPVWRGHVLKLGSTTDTPERQDSPALGAHRRSGIIKP